MYPLSLLRYCKTFDFYSTFDIQLTLKLLIKYYNNFIHPCITYDILLYYPLSTLTLTKSLHILQNRTLRLMCGSQQKRNKEPSATHLLRTAPTSSPCTSLLILLAFERAPSFYPSATRLLHTSQPIISIKFPVVSTTITQYNSLSLSWCCCFPYAFKHNFKKHLFFVQHGLAFVSAILICYVLILMYIASNLLDVL